MQPVLFNSLPTTGFIRQAALLGVTEVTPAQARQNKLSGKGPRRPRRGTPPIIPWSSATLWRKIKAGEFCDPVKLSARTTGFRVEDVRRWLEAQIPKPPVHALPALDHLSLLEHVLGRHPRIDRIQSKAIVAQYRHLLESGSESPGNADSKGADP